MRTHRLPHDLIAPTLGIRRPAAPADVGATPPPPGALPRVSGYEILSVIGHGGMGVVYEARHTELNRRVALKTLRGEALADPEFRERFRAEAEAIARLQHPNIIQVFEVGITDPAADGAPPSPFLALEYVDGGNLTRYTGAPQPPRLAAALVEVLARAAHAAHRLGVVHRDLKPANVLLTRDGRPKIADFGIAKRIDAEHVADHSLTRVGAIMGTPEYMAPEHLQGARTAPTVDVYALGVILYELLTGRVPFRGATFADTMLLVLQQDPVPPRKLQPGVPRELETICLKCLDKSAARRYESADALADDLIRWAEGRAIRANPVGPAGRAARWARRNPLAAGLSVAVLLVAVVGLAGVVWTWSEARQSAALAAEAAERATKSADAATTSALKERWERYRASVFAASSALRVHDAGAARRALDDAPAEHRDWVWRLLRAQLDRSRAVLGEPREFSTDGAHFAATGRRVLLRDEGNALRVCDLEARREVRVPGTGLSVQGGALGDDGTTLLYRTGGGEAVVYDPTAGAVRARLSGHAGPIDFAQLTPDGARAVTAGADGTVRFWDARDGKPLRTFAVPQLERVRAFSPDMSVVVDTGPGSRAPRVWDLAAGRERARLRGHTEHVRAVLFSPRGDRILTVEAYPANVLRLWDAATGAPLAAMAGHENEVACAAFNHAGTRVATGSLDRTVRVWDVSPALTGRRTAAGQLLPLLVLKGHIGWVEHATFSPDDRRVVSCAHDGTLRYWDAETGEPLAVLTGHTGRVIAAAFDPDGKRIHSAGADGTVRTWDVQEIEDDYAIRGHAKFVYGVSFHPDGLRVASAAWDGTARVWDVTARRELLCLKHPPDPTPDGVSATPYGRVVSAAAYDPTGRRLVTVARDDSVRLWDGETGRLLHRWATPTSDWRDTRVAFSPDGALVAVGDPKGGVHLLDAAARTEAAVLGGHADGVRDVAFSPDGRWLASAADNEDCTIRVWDVAARTPARVLTITPAAGRPRGVYAVAWNPKAPLLAAGGYDGAVRLWNTTTWEPVGEAPMGQGANVYALAFTPDGELLAVACSDNLIRVWSVKARQLLAELSGHTDYVHALAFSPDGTRLVSASGDRSLRVWDVVPSAERNRK